SSLSQEPSPHPRRPPGAGTRGRRERPVRASPRRAAFVRMSRAGRPAPSIRRRAPPISEGGAVMSPVPPPGGLRRLFGRRHGPWKDGAGLGPVVRAAQELDAVAGRLAAESGDQVVRGGTGLHPATSR